MTSSLVGSEMCIRDRRFVTAVHLMTCKGRKGGGVTCKVEVDGGERFMPVSYTHLTLPTICSV
eukprot:4766987-Prorocentrum_lima.AAC.1